MQPHAGMRTRNENEICREATYSEESESDSTMMQENARDVLHSECCLKKHALERKTRLLKDIIINNVNQYESVGYHSTMRY